MASIGALNIGLQLLPEDHLPNIERDCHAKRPTSALLPFSAQQSHYHGGDMVECSAGISVLDMEALLGF